MPLPQMPFRSAADTLPSAASSATSLSSTVGSLRDAGGPTDSSRSTKTVDRAPPRPPSCRSLRPGAEAFDSRAARPSGLASDPSGAKLPSMRPHHARVELRCHRRRIRGVDGECNGERGGRAAAAVVAVAHAALVEKVRHAAQVVAVQRRRAAHAHRVQVEAGAVAHPAGVHLPAGAARARLVQRRRDGRRRAYAADAAPVHHGIAALAARVVHAAGALRRLGAEGARVAGVAHARHRRRVAGAVPAAQLPQAEVARLRVARRRRGNVLAGQLRARRPGGVRRAVPRLANHLARARSPPAGGAARPPLARGPRKARREALRGVALARAGGGLEGVAKGGGVHLLVVEVAQAPHGARLRAAAAGRAAAPPLAPRVVVVPAEGRVARPLLHKVERRDSRHDVRGGRREVARLRRDPEGNADAGALDALEQAGLHAPPAGLGASAPPLLVHVRRRTGQARLRHQAGAPLVACGLGAGALDVVQHRARVRLHAPYRPLSETSAAVAPAPGAHGPRAGRGRTARERRRGGLRGGAGEGGYGGGGGGGGRDVEDGFRLKVHHRPRHRVVLLVLGHGAVAQRVAGVVEGELRPDQGHELVALLLHEARVRSASGVPGEVRLVRPQGEHQHDHARVAEVRVAHAAHRVDPLGRRQPPPAPVPHVVRRESRAPLRHGRQAREHQKRGERRVALRARVGGVHHKGHPVRGDVVLARLLRLGEREVVDVLTTLEEAAPPGRGSSDCGDSG
eukprot:416132-Prorocentrum_minimum.AAC.1